jgi:threonine aldolase
LLCGSRDFIDEARRTRQHLGGGMRQAGTIAAAGIVAFNSMIDRLAEDHLTARALADGLGCVRGLKVRPVKRRTNMVVFEVKRGPGAARRFAATLKDRGVLVGARRPTAFRAVTHYGISRADIDVALATAAEAAAVAFAN